MKIREIQVSYKLTDKTIPDNKIDSSDSVAGLFKNLQDADREKFCVLHLSTGNQVLGFEVVSIGTLTESLISSREIFKSALLMNSKSLILVHNHPSGDPSPSECDKKITERIKQAAALFEIQILDHVIIGSETHYSFADSDIL